MAAWGRGIERRSGGKTDTGSQEVSDATDFD